MFKRETYDVIATTKNSDIRIQITRDIDTLRGVYSVYLKADNLGMSKTAVYDLNDKDNHDFKQIKSWLFEHGQTLTTLTQ